MFSERLRQLRKEKNYTQEQLAEMVDISKRTLINYEQGRCYPKQTEILSKLASIFDVTVDYLISEEDKYVQEASERGGGSAAKEVAAFLSSARTMFAGGRLSEEDKDKVMRKLNELYWDARVKNSKKYGRNSD
ncbi:MAG: 30S ribosomal protein S9 [Clostridia bacterium]|jgi:transcriptional regulator with XRE-family HTH domain|nr:30S ribosomal protein S9 [Clostridia bacterium]MBQ3868677.1 30S ribosomal protein S9 [Clostridia bacterium]MBR0159444.1 30S ribosomal protein S9 [Clostridia bacterium]MBR7063182.1 30S ribosomal protein S9 [Clostridia bacterium]